MKTQPQDIPEILAVVDAAKRSLTESIKAVGPLSALDSLHKWSKDCQKYVNTMPDKCTPEQSEVGSLYAAAIVGLYSLLEDHIINGLNSPKKG